MLEKGGRSADLRIYPGLASELGGRPVLPPYEPAKGTFAGAEEAAHRAAFSFAAEEALLTHPPRRRPARGEVAASPTEDFVVEKDPGP